MKILQIGKGWFLEEPGGLNRYYYDCTQYLPKVGVEVHGLVAGTDSVRTSTHGRVHTFSPANASLVQRWQTIRQVASNQLHAFDLPLVVSHFALYTFPILNQLGDRPLVVHFHGPWALESRAEGSPRLTAAVKKQIEQTCYRRGTRFIVLSNAFRDILHREYKVPLEAIDVVPGGVDCSHFQLQLSQQEARQKLGWPTDRPIIVAVRRLAKRMGLENLIEAVAHVKQQQPDILLCIAGDGALRKDIEKQVKDLGLEPYVRLLGYVPDEDLPLVYRAADFSVVPTMALEGFGLVVVESLASGTPVLGTPIGGIPETLLPLSEDLVLAGCTTDDLARGIKEALSGQRSLPSAEVCSTYADKHFSWPTIAQHLQSIYSTAHQKTPAGV